MKPTPVAEVSPMLPNTMVCTLTAVPRLCGMSFSLRYVIARGFIHDLKTASRAPTSCSRGSCGKGLPVSFCTTAL